MASLFPPIEEVSSRPRVEHIPLGFYIPSLGCVHVRAPSFPCLLFGFNDEKTQRNPSNFIRGMRTTTSDRVLVDDDLSLPLNRGRLPSEVPITTFVI